MVSELKSGSAEYSRIWQVTRPSAVIGIELFILRARPYVLYTGYDVSKERVRNKEQSNYIGGILSRGIYRGSINIL